MTVIAVTTSTVVTATGLVARDWLTSSCGIDEARREASFAFLACNRISERTPETVIVATSSPPQSHDDRPRVGQRPVDTNAVEAAARLMSETAHDLRSPLTTVRESIRLVREGDLGDVSQDQEMCLGSAMDQCDCMEQMIGEMVQLERLRTGAPRANRQWVAIDEVRSAIEETLRPWALPRQIDVLWDLQVEPAAKVFADVAMLRRLIVNLVTNAIRVTSENGGILVRLQSVRGGETVRWTVIDRGAGMKEQELRQIAERQFSMGGGEGLGLSICRQLAAVHFSSLEIRSRHGIGTEVSFETAAAGPRSVAHAWSRWRVGQRGPLQSPQHRDHPIARMEANSSQMIRLDPPVVKVELAHEATVPRCENRIAAGVVSLGVTVPRELADQFDRLFQDQLQIFDFAYRVDTRRWVWAFDVDAHGVQDRIESITDTVMFRIPGMRMNWTNPQMIPVDIRRTHTRISDLLIREALAASTVSCPSDSNSVRLGTTPIAPSNVAASRLDQELRRLTGQLKSQTRLLREQAKNLRPVS